VRFTSVVFCFFLGFFNSFSHVDENQIGSWYMYFFNNKFENSNWGIQGDIQHRDWAILGDQEQLMLRSGITYIPKNSGAMFTFGFANITTGDFGDSDGTFNENRLYQEVLFSQKLENRFFITHRFRYEQRFIENQDFRTRYRYNFFLNIPLNSKGLSPKTIYAAFYNELFINGEKSIGNNNSVEIFDRNRTYFGMGYVLNKIIKFQVGIMKQTTSSLSKNQLQISMHHNF
jgi:hypothetical protein